MSERELTIRERIKAIQTEMLRGEINPHRAADVLVQLTALLGNLTAEIGAATHDYNVVRRTLFRTSGKAAHAKIEGEATEEYARKCSAEAIKGDVQELINALKVLIREAMGERSFTPR